MKGALVATVADDNMTEGWKEVIWTGTNHSGGGVASGVYFYHLVAGRVVKKRKMALLR